MPSFGTAKSTPSDSLSQLVKNASHNKLGDLAYAGEISSRDTYDFVSKNPAVIVDVRTIPEWQFVGVPDLSATPSKLLTVSWKVYPSFMLNPQFIDMLTADSDINQDTPLFFLCRSGGRSLDAAVSMTSEGYHYCFNVADGFEGGVDVHGRRGVAQGWKAAKLPWGQG